jgi:hypothetical protein
MEGMHTCIKPKFGKIQELKESDIETTRMGFVELRFKFFLCNWVGKVLINSVDCKRTKKELSWAIKALTAHALLL